MPPQQEIMVVHINMEVQHAKAASRNFSNGIGDMILYIYVYIYTYVYIYIYIYLHNQQKLGLS